MLSRHQAQAKPHFGTTFPILVGVSRTPSPCEPHFGTTFSHTSGCFADTKPLPHPTLESRFPIPVGVSRTPKRLPNPTMEQLCQKPASVSQAQNQARCIHFLHLFEPNALTNVFCAEGESAIWTYVSGTSTKNHTMIWCINKGGPY